LRTKIIVGIILTILVVSLSLSNVQASASHNNPKAHPLILREPYFTLQPIPDSTDILVTGYLVGTPGSHLTIRIILQVTPTQTVGLNHGQAVFTWTDRNGDQILGTLDGYIKANSDGTSSVFFTFLVTGGTGTYAGATGQGLHWGTITTDQATGAPSGSGWYVGTIIY
jgi:hypothetical protein